MVEDRPNIPKTRRYRTMRNTHIAWTLALTLLLIVGCAAPQQDNTEEARAGIETTNQQWMAAFSKGDAAGVAACYTEDAQLLPPNSEIVSGREAVQANYQETMNAGLNVRLESVELESHGDTAYEVGRAITTGEDGQTIDESKYIVIWKKVGDAWKLHRDIFNSNLPLPTEEEHGDEEGEHEHEES